MLVALLPSALLTALTNNRKGGFWPDSSASELPAGCIVLTDNRLTEACISTCSIQTSYSFAWGQEWQICQDPVQGGKEVEPIL